MCLGHCQTSINVNLCNNILQEDCFNHFLSLRYLFFLHAASPLDYETPLNIVLYPDPRLRAKNKRIAIFDEKLEKFAKEMFEVMYK